MSHMVSPLGHAARVKAIIKLILFCTIATRALLLTSSRSPIVDTGHKGPDARCQEMGTGGHLRRRATCAAYETAARMQSCSCVLRFGF